MILDVDVVGIPAPQGSKRAFVRNGRANLVEVAGNALKAWRAEVEAAARAAMTDDTWYTLDVPVRVHILFRMPRPKSRPDDEWHAVRPDVDKLTRAVLDALTDAAVWHDDCLVAELKVWKRYETVDRAAGAGITVERLP